MRLWERLFGVKSVEQPPVVEPPPRAQPPSAGAPVRPWSPHTEALIAAAKAANDEEAARLIQLGADVDGLDAEGFTSLHYACMRKHNTRVTLLHVLGAAGADPRIATPQGDTPLHLAARDKGTGAVERLLRLNEYASWWRAAADVNAINTHGWTALHIAANHGDATIVDMLLNAGANIYILDRNGKSAWDWADEWGHCGRFVPLGALSDRLRGSQYRV